MTNPADNPHADGQQSPRWYCRRSNQTIGPVSTEEVIEFIRRRTLADYDLVRLDGADDWQKVREIRRLLTEPPVEFAGSGATKLESSRAMPQPPEHVVEKDIETVSSVPGDGALPSHPELPPTAEPDDESHDAAHAALEALSHMHAARLRRAAAGKSPRRRRVRAGKSYSLALIEGASAAVTWLLVQMGRGLQLRSVQAALAILLIAGILWGVVLPRWPIDSRALLAEFTSLSERIEKQRDGDASPFAWQQLEQDVRATIGDSIDRLDREAGSQRPDLQELLAAAGLLPAAVREGQSVDTDSRLATSKLAIHLENAERHLARRDELNAKAAQGAGSWFTGDAMFWGIVLVDVLMVVALGIWGVRMLHRRTRSRETQAAA